MARYCQSAKTAAAKAMAPVRRLPAAFAQFRMHTRNSSVAHAESRALRKASSARMSASAKRPHPKRSHRTVLCSKSTLVIAPSILAPAAVLLKGKRGRPAAAEDAVRRERHDLIANARSLYDPLHRSHGYAAAGIPRASHNFSRCKSLRRMSNRAVRREVFGPAAFCTRRDEGFPPG